MKDKLRNLFVGSTQSTLKQLFRYAFVGGIAFIVDYGALFLLTEYAHFHYILSASISFILGLITNYLLSISWVFNNRKLEKRYMEFLIFAIIGIVGLGLNAAIMYVATDWCNLHYMISKIISTIIVFFWNFFARKFILFKVN